MDIESLGFPSWLALYEYIYEANLHLEQRVGLVYPQELPNVMDNTREPFLKVVDREVIIDVDTICANAFREIFPKLPQARSVELITEMVETTTTLAGRKYTQPTLEFLKKIPTRSK